MKTAGIVTLQGYSNLGNRLQNYATMKILENLGVKPENIVFRPTLNTRMKLVPYEFSVRSSSRFPFIDRRYVELRRFSKSFLPSRVVNMDRKNLDGMAAEYDYFILGSDQVWNPSSLDPHSGIPFLDFALPSQRVTVSPSFGISEIPLEFREVYREGLLGFDDITVRENDGAALVSSLSGKRAAVTIDPTMMIEADAWRSWIEAEKGVSFEGEYLLVYCLGKVSSERMQWIESLASRKNLSICNMNDPHVEAYGSGPLEFLKLIDNASLVVTDSFHGLVFSLLFHKEFFCPVRAGGESMHSRIETLQAKFSIDIEGREEGSLVPCEVDYCLFEQRVKQERLVFMQHLRKQIEG